jgi:hypothetical protein
VRAAVVGLVWALGVASEPDASDVAGLRSEVLGEVGDWRFEARCSAQTCIPVLVVPGAGGSVLVLPTVPDDPPWEVDGVALHKLTLVDLDSDAKPELKVEWRAISKPRAAVGSWHRDLTTIVDTRAVAVRMHVETGSFGGASEMHCAGTLTFQSDAATLNQGCQLRACMVGGALPGECETGPKQQTHRVTWMR